ncbi:DUF1474 family protein [Mammaliicoccus sciuri]|uniref:type II toxin-antitoxin system toxin TscT n=1 Tax=Mammaliicoccus sciuri TaxID=1296 RepID=UPI003364F19A
MNNNLLSLEDIHCDLELVRDKIGDLCQSIVWQGEDKFKFEYLKSNSEVVSYGLGYDEHRIQHDQLIDLLRTYNQLLEEAMEKLKQHCTSDGES